MRPFGGGCVQGSGLNPGTARIIRKLISDFTRWAKHAPKSVLAIMGNPKSLILSLTGPRRQGSLESDVDKVPQVEKWKRMLYMGSMTSATVLVLNLVMVLWASLRDSKDGKGILRVDNCDRIKQLSTGIHFLINMLSTLLLAASNFAMVCLSVLFIPQLCAEIASAAMSGCTDQEGCG